MNTQIIIKTANGSNSLLGLIDAIDRNAVPTVGDLMYAGQRQRTRILDRTARGVDVDEQSFAPYSTNGPYYYYPSKNSKNRHAAAGRIANKLGIKKKVTPAQKRAGIVGRTRLGIKFANYAAFKASLGRFLVDLRGPSAPHMLQAIIVRVGGLVSQVNDLFTGENTAPASEITIGIYGDEALRASGHNEGTAHLPRRHFMGANDSDKTAMMDDILSRMIARVKKAIGGAP